MKSKHDAEASFSFSPLKMDSVDSAESSSKPVKRPTIIRASLRSGTTNSTDEDNNQSSNFSTVDSVQDPAENSDAAIKRIPPARPPTGPSRDSSFKAPARPASLHLGSSERKSTQRPASVHLPLSHAPAVKDKPAAGKPQRRRPEITIVSARPLSEVEGFSKDTSSASGPTPAARSIPTAAAKPAVETPADTPTTSAEEVPSNTSSRQGINKVSSKPTPPVVDKKPQPPGVTGGTDMSGAPPPLPTNRPKGPYVPPPLPGTRPKGSYVHPGLVPSSSVSEEKVTSDAVPVPKPRPRSVVADTNESSKGQAAPIRPPQTVTRNHVLDESSKLITPNNKGQVNSEKPVAVHPPVSSSKPEAASKPPVILKPPVQVEQPRQAPIGHSKPRETPQLPLKPAEKPAVPHHPVTPLKPAENPPLPHPVIPPKPTQQTGNTLEIAVSSPSDSSKASHQGPVPPKPNMPHLPSASGQKYSRSDILSLFDTTYKKNTKPDSSSDAQIKVAGAVASNVSTENALKFGSTAATVAAADKTRSGNEVSALHYASAAAQNTTKQDVNNISGGVKVLRQSEDGQKAASSFTRIAKSTASDVRSADSSSGDLKWQVASSAAKNVTADDAKTMGKAGVTLAKSEEGRKAASSIFSIARASMNQVNQTQSQNPTAPSPTARARPKNTGQQSGSSLGSLMGLMPPPKPQAQATTKPASTSVSKPAPIPKFKIIAEATATGVQRSKPTIIRPGGEKPGSKPNSRSNSPDPKRKVPPPRPASGPQGKSKASAPQRPSAPSSQPKSASSANLKPKRQAPLKPGAAKKSSQTESLPPRPGPGHPLYNKYMVSEPHGIALYDYKPIQPDELGFKANDVIVLLKRIDADWLRGRCGDAEGLLPATFLKIVNDLPQADNKPSTIEPCAVAVYSFEGSSSDELRFKEGDDIVLLERVGDQWYRGQCKGRTGIFPANHVKVTEDLPVKSAPISSSIVSGPRCKAKFDYNSANSEDLTFKAGDVIKLVEDIGSQWLKGRLGSKMGIFPESFVDIIEALPAKKSSTVMNGNSGNVVKAVFDFNAAESNEISFTAGDKITILSQVSSEWLHGELGSGLRGNLPSAFVDHIPTNLPSFTADSPSEIGECVAKFDFEPAGEGELALKAGDRVTLLEYVGEDWLRGRIGSKEGMFPKTFADIVGKGGSSIGGASLGTCKAIYDFHAEEADELTIVIKPDKSKPVLVIGAKELYYIPNES